MTDTDVKTGRDLQEKTPSENYPFDFIFTALKDAETINSVIEVIQTSRNTVPSIPVVITNITHNNANTGQVWVADGTDGEHYCLTMQVQTSLGAIRTCSGILLVRSPC